MIAAEVTSPAKILSYLGVSTQEIIGAEVYVTNDGGNSWQKLTTNLSTICTTKTENNSEALP